MLDWAIRGLYNCSVSLALALSIYFDLFHVETVRGYAVELLVEIFWVFCFRSKILCLVVSVSNY